MTFAVPMTRAVRPALLAALALLAGALFYGGWPWAAMAAVSAAVAWTDEDGDRPAVQSALVAMVWLALFQATGDRRLFFPFSIHAAALAGRWGVGVVAAFAAIRMTQGASAHVLGVEMVVAAVVLGLAAALRPYAGRSGSAAAAGLAALAGLLV